MQQQVEVYYEIHTKKGDIVGEALRHLTGDYIADKSMVYLASETLILNRPGLKSEFYKAMKVADPEATLETLTITYIEQAPFERFSEEDFEEHLLRLK